MTNAKHTPGPWEVLQKYAENNTYPIGRYTGLTAGAPIIADVFGCGGMDSEDSANAHLIAAAPELLEALQDMTSAIDPGGASDVEPFFLPVLEQARAAIAKATADD